MEKVSITLCSVVLLAYYIFTSGVVYELTNSDTTINFGVPYSLGLSAERTGLAGIFNDDDIKCAKWMVENWDGETIIVADYNGSRLLVQYSSKFGDKFYNLQFEELPEKCYIFMSAWNVEHDKYVMGSIVGLRELRDLPKCDCDCDCKCPVVFQSGKSTIYKK